MDDLLKAIDESDDQISLLCHVYVRLFNCNTHQKFLNGLIVSKEFVTTLTDAKIRNPYFTTFKQ